MTIDEIRLLAKAIAVANGHEAEAGANAYADKVVKAAIELAKVKPEKSE
jgi:hypothetical protein